MHCCSTCRVSSLTGDCEAQSLAILQLWLCRAWGIASCADEYHSSAQGFIRPACHNIGCLRECMRLVKLVPTQEVWREESWCWLC